MGRHASVDRDTALDRVMGQFWRAGYAASSIDDLLAASGLQRASFYRSFGDKHQAFLAALKRYMKQAGLAHVVPALAPGTSPVRRLRHLLYARLDAALGVIPGAASGADRPGCMVVNTAIELAAHDPEIRKLVESGLGTIRDTIETLLREAVAAGEVPRGLDVEFAAFQLFALLQGVNVLARAGGKRAALRQLLRRSVETSLGAAASADD